MRASSVPEQLRPAATARPQWLDETIIEIIISEAQNEVARLQEVGLRHHPAPRADEAGLRDAGRQARRRRDAFKNPEHPFRVAIVCAMWLTGFDVECLSTLYIDKPMKAHTLMQAIARANRVYPGKDFGLIVDYNGMLKSLREALAQYALGDDGAGGEEIVAPIEERVQALLEAIEATEAHLRGLGFDPAALIGAKGFARIEARRRGGRRLYDATRPSGGSRSWRGRCSSASRRCSWSRASFAYAERHDNIEAIYKKLTERRDTADVTELLKELHRIVNEAIRTQSAGRRPGRGADLRPEPDRSGEAARRVREEGHAQGDRAPGHPGHRRAEARRDAGAQPAADGLSEEIRGDRRRLQPREGPRRPSRKPSGSWSSW